MLLLIAAVTGSMVIGSLVDGSLGFVPTELGPFFRHRPAIQINRMQTLLIEWALIVVTGMAVSGLYLAIATTLGMAAPHALLLWAYGTLAISLVGVAAVSIVAAFGSAGLLINIICFLFLGLPSAGATIPHQAAPPIFEWLSDVEPIHQVYRSVRAILYFDASADAGLLQGVASTVTVGIIGVIGGAAVVIVYDRTGLTRSDRTRDDADAGLPA